MDTGLRTAGLLLTAAAAAVLATPAGAGADSPDMEHYEFSGTFTEVICGIEVDIAVEASGLFGARTVKGSDGQAFLGMDVFKVVETWTTDTGTVTIQRHGSFREKTATKVEGPVTYDPDGPGPLAPVTSDDVWRFTAQDNGFFRVHDADGRVLLKATGSFRMAVVFDTLGDSQVGGVEVPGTFEVLREQTGRSFTEDDFCDVITAELT